MKLVFGENDFLLVWETVLSANSEWLRQQVFALLSSAGAKKCNHMQNILHFLFAVLRFNFLHFCTFTFCMRSKIAIQLFIADTFRNVPSDGHTEKDRCRSHVPDEHRSSSVFCERVVILIFFDFNLISDYFQV